MEDNKLNIFRKPTWVVTMFFSLACLHIYFIQFKNISTSPVTKVLPLVILLLFIVNQSKKTFKTYLLALAVIFCGAGDVILDVAFQNYFLIGVGAFAIGHCLYIITFKETFTWNNTKYLPIFLIVGLYAFTIFKVAPKAGEMLPLLALYFSLMLIFGITIVMNKLTNKLAFWGVFFFLLSDFLFAYHMFVQALPLRSVWVLSTYYTAQLFIVFGYCNTYKETFLFSANQRNSLLSH